MVNKVGYKLVYKSKHEGSVKKIQGKTGRPMIFQGEGIEYDDAISHASNKNGVH